MGIVQYLQQRRQRLDLPRLQQIAAAVTHTGDPLPPQGFHIRPR